MQQALVQNLAPHHSEIASVQLSSGCAAVSASASTSPGGASATAGGDTATAGAAADPVAQVRQASNEAVQHAQVIKQKR